MAIARFSEKDLERRGFGIKTLEELAPKMGIEVGRAGSGEVTVEVTPNRPDLLDSAGLVRALSDFSGRRRPIEGRYTVGGIAGEIITTRAVNAIRPCMAGIIAKGLDLSGNELRYLINFTEKLCETYGRKRRKFAIGLHNLDVVGFPLTFDAARDREFVPLGATKKMSFESIIAGHEKGVQYSDTIAGGKDRAYPYLRDAKGNIMGMIPIIDSEFTRVTESTKNLFVDVAGMSKTGIGLAARLLACSFIDAGAKVYPCRVMYGSRSEVAPDMAYKEVKVKIGDIQRSLGVPVSPDSVVGLANRLGHVAAKLQSSLLVKVAPYRVDVLNEQDIIEDIAIAYGYDRIVPLPLIGYAQGAPNSAVERTCRLAEFVVGLGFTEAMNNYLTNEGLNFKSMMLKFDPDDVVKVSYAKTENITMLRTNILHGLLQDLSISKGERMPQRLFETGSVFSVKAGKPIEGGHLALVSEHSRANFAEMRAFVEAALKHMRVEDYALEESGYASLWEGRRAEIKVRGRSIGHFGEVHPQVLENFEIEEPVVAAEIDIDQV